MKRKLCVVFLIMAVLISALVVEVRAEGFSTTLTASSNTVTPSGEVMITIAVKNLNVGDEGISGFSANFIYDTNVFETVTDSNMSCVNNWTSTYSSGTNTITLKKNSFVNKDEDMLQITLKVKPNLAEGTKGTVTLTKISVSNSETNINGNDVSTTITVGKNTTIQIPDNNTANNGSGTNKVILTNNNVTNNTPAPRNENTNQEVPNNNTNTSEKKLPYTGPEGNAMIEIILGVVLISLFIYIKIEKMNEDK